MIVCLDAKQVIALSALCEYNPLRNRDVTKLKLASVGSWRQKPDFVSQHNEL
jgi:hypothetical protein